MLMVGCLASMNGINERSFWPDGVARVKMGWFGDSVIYIFNISLLGCLCFIIELINKAKNRNVMINCVLCIMVEGAYVRVPFTGDNEVIMFGIR